MILNLNLTVEVADTLTPDKVGQVVADLAAPLDSLGWWLVSADYHASDLSEDTHADEIADARNNHGQEDT